MSAREDVYVPYSAYSMLVLKSTERNLCRICLFYIVMVQKEKRATIAVSKAVRDRLGGYGTTSQTFENVLVMLMDCYDEYHGKEGKNSVCRSV